MVIWVLAPLVQALCATFVHSAELKDGSDCAGYSVADAAGALKVPAAQLRREVGRGTGETWLCSYYASKSTPVISFAITFLPGAAQAATEMQNYRKIIADSAGTAKDKPATWAYSDVSGIGDEAIWTDLNKTLAVRKGRVMYMFMTPSDKTELLAIAKAVLAKN